MVIAIISVAGYGNKTRKDHFSDPTGIRYRKNVCERTDFDEGQRPSTWVAAPHHRSAYRRLPPDSVVLAARVGAGKERAGVRINGNSTQAAGGAGEGRPDVDVVSPG